MAINVKHFDANTKGKDYIVGDLHGCISVLEDALSAIGFNRTTDRLFSVGDLVDRGPENYRTAWLIDESWFHAVRGNHDQMLIDCFTKDDQFQQAQYTMSYGGWIHNGEQTHDQLIDLANYMDYAMPYLISVGEGADRFNIVHAELLKHNVAVSDTHVDAFDFIDEEIESMIWGRSIASGYTSARTINGTEVYDQTNLSLTYCGHTPMYKVSKILNQMFIDRGCVFASTAAARPYSNKEFRLSIACHTDKVIHEWNPNEHQLDSLPFPS